MSTRDVPGVNTLLKFPSKELKEWDIKVLKKFISSFKSLEDTN